MSQFLEPPKQHDAATRDGHALDGPDPTTMAPAHADPWNRAPDDESALLGPTLGDPGRGFDLGRLAIDTLESAVGGLPDQPHLALAQLDDLAGKQLADVDQRADLFGLGTGPVAVAQTAPAVLPKVAGPAKTAPPDRTALLGQINAAGSKELAELDAGLQRQLTELDRTFTAEQKQLGGEVGAQERKTSSATTAGDRSLKREIATQDHDNQRQIAAESTKNAREVTKQRATLGKTAASERGWHGATRDQILAEDVNPHIASHVAAPRAAGTVTTIPSVPVLMQAELSSQKLAADGATLIATQNARTEAAQAAITTEETKQGDRIQTQSTIANNEMEMHGTLAQARMEIERSGFTAQATGAAADASGAMSAESTAAKARGDALKGETATKMRSTHANAKAQVEARVAKLRADLAATADVDLTRRRRTMGKELASLDGSDQTANAAMKRQAKDGATTISAENDLRAQRIRAEGAKARAAVATFVQDARKRIVAANKSTDRDIAGAAKRGREAIHAVGADASNELVAFSNARQSLDVAAASTDLDGYDRKAATASMRFLNGLPPHLQGPAIAKLTAEQFDSLVKDVPEGNREELAALVKNTADPERKLQLWGTYHKAHVTGDVARDKPGADAESQRRHTARDTAAKTTHGEVDDEIAFMQQQVATTGTALSITDVDDLIARKDAEHALEMKYNVNFTNQGGARISGANNHALGSHIHWEKDELEMLDNTLAQLPEAHLAGNPNLKQMKRTEQIPWGTAQTWLAGSSGGGDILIGDKGAKLSGSDMRHAGDRRELVDPALAGRSSHVSPLEMTVTHELGHDMQDRYAADYAEYQRVMGWQNHDAAGTGLAAPELAKLEAGRQNPYDNRKYVTDSNKDFRVDPNGAAGSYRSTHAGAIPAKGQHEMGTGGDADTWGYARTNDNEMFAEHYAKAVQVPEMLHKDLVARPEQAVTLAQAEVERLQTLRVAAMFNPQQAMAIDPQLVAARTTLASAQDAKKLRKQEFDIMRDKVFNTDAAQLTAEARLQAKGISSTKLDEFKKAAATASTPTQLSTIEALY